MPSLFAQPLVHQSQGGFQLCAMRDEGKMQAFKFFLIGPGRGCGSQVAQTSRLQEGLGAKKGEDGKRNYFILFLGRFR